MARLIIRRKASIKYIFRVPFKIFVDGQEMGNIYPSEKIECDLVEGKHLIVISTPEKSIEQGIIIKKETESVEVVLGTIRIYVVSIPQIRDIIYR